MRNSVNSIIEQYNKEVDALPEIHSRGGGAARNASGLVYENLIKRTCIFSNLDPKKNDYFRTKEINGKSLRTLQVDWHVYNDGKLTKLVESKTYLDRCYLERAVTDFIKLNQSPDVPDDAEYCIFAGQNACADDALEYYKEYFKHEDIDFGYMIYKIVEGQNINEINLTEKNTKKPRFFEKFFQLFS